MWSRIPTTFAGARTGHTATRHGSFAVIVGGYDVCNDASELDATVFDLEAMRDAKIDADGCGFENRAGHTAVVHGGGLYIFGGEIIGMDTTECCDDVLVARVPEEGGCEALRRVGLTWASLQMAPAEPAPLDEQGHVQRGWCPPPDDGPPPGRAWHAAAMLHAVETGAPTGEMVTFGGKGKGGSLLNDTWVLDLATGRWRKPPTTGRAPLPRAHHTLTFVGGSEAALAVVGGFGADEPGPHANVHILCTAVYPPRQQHTMAEDGTASPVPVAGSPTPAMMGDGRSSPSPAAPRHEPWKWSTLKVNGPGLGLRCQHTALALQPPPSGDVTTTLMQNENQANSTLEQGDLASDEAKVGAEGEEAISVVPPPQPRWPLLLFGGRGAGVDLTSIDCNDGTCSTVEYNGDEAAERDTSDRVTKLASGDERVGHSMFALNQTPGADGGMKLFIWGGVGRSSAPDGDNAQCPALVFDMGAKPQSKIAEAGGMSRGWGRHTFDDNSVFEGQFRSGQRHGQGTMKYADGDGVGSEYDGAWLNDVREGEGVCKWRSGTVYNGQWHNDAREGDGVCQYQYSDNVERDGASGRKLEYSGQWREDKFHGSGTCSYGPRDRPDSYVGEWRDGVRHGQGTLTYGVGGHYVGGWADDLCEGEGVLTNAAGDVYEGVFEKGYLVGDGLCHYHLGGEYTGLFRGGLRTGFGKMTYHCRDVYDGKWFRDDRCGHGVCTYIAGHTYDGSWKADKRDGYGEFRAKQGDVYVGQWRCDVRCGSGKQKYADGTEYDGEFKDDVRHGQGEFRGKGLTYVGEWRHDCRHGQGKEVDQHGDTYDGNWEKDLRSGQGRVLYANGDVYQGDFRDNVQNGEGELTCTGSSADGLKRYTGQFCNGRMHGHGEARYNNGNTYTGDWRAGQRAGVGVLKCSNGDKFSGQWTNDQQNGTGICEYGNGDKYEGEWKDGQRHVRSEGEN